MIARLARFLGVVRLVHLRELRLHPLRTLIAVVSVAAGVAMVLAVVVVVSATTASFERQAEGLAGPAPLRVVGATSAGGLEIADVWTIAGTDGVAGVGAMVRGVAQLEEVHETGVELTDDVIVLGVDCPTAAVLGVRCEDLAAGLVASPGLASAAERDGTSIRTAVGRVDLEPAAEAGRLADIAPRTAVVGIAEAQRMLQRADRIDIAYVLPDDGASIAEVRSALESRLPDGLDVLAATDPPPEFGQVLATIVPLFGLIGLLALGIGMILVANTVTLSLEERRLQLAVVGALGGTGGQIVAGALLQAVLLGLAGGLLGTAGAVALAIPLTDSVSSFTLPISGVSVDAGAADPPVVLGLVLGAIVAGVAAWRPARRARRSDVAAELSRRDRREDATTGALAPRALFVVAIGVWGAGLAAAGGADGSLDGWQPTVGLAGLLIAILGLTLAMGRVTALVATWILRRVAPANAAVRLALANLAREPARTGVMAVGVGAAVGTAFLVASFAESSRAGIIDGVTAEIGDTLVVSVGDEESNDVFHSVPPDVVDAIAARPDVAEVIRESFAFTSGEAASIAIEGTEAELTDLGLTVFDGTVDPERFVAGEVMVGAGLARVQGIGAGDMVEIPLRDGVVEVPVLGVWANGNAVGNSITMPYSLLQELLGPVPVEVLMLRPADGTTTAELAAAIAASPPDSALRLETAPEAAARVADSVDTQLAPFWALQRGLTIVAFIAVLSTMLLVGIQRTRELGLLAAVGMTPATIGGMILVEALVLGVLGVAVASVLATVMALALSAVTPLIIGWENPIRMAFSAIPLYGTITIALAVAGAALPAWRASRVQVVEALAYE